uniref:Uncharacterized protein n=1 Tax=Oryza glaberrima TaxID=4538 RepID=I1Q990_ORYGL
MDPSNGVVQLITNVRNPRASAKAMWRPILLQPRRTPISHLRRRGHDATDDDKAVLPLRRLIGSRGYASSSDATNAAAAAAANIAAPRADSRRRRRPPAAKAKAKQHLYVVLNDRKDACEIHKLDIDGGGGGRLMMNAGDMASLKTLRRLPEPPLLRLQSPTVHPCSKFTTVGSSIVNMGEYFSDHYCGDWFREARGNTLVYDTKTAALTVVRHLPEGLLGVYDFVAAIAVGANRLYVLDEGTMDDYRGRIVGGMHCFRLTDDDDDGSRKKKERWSWWQPDESTRISWSDHPSRLPFDTITGQIEAYAVHPKGRTFFVSVRQVDDEGTFSYSVESGKWTRRGDWMLPFVGHGHYDGELGSWVGLHHSDDDGRLSACRVVSARQRRALPEVKVSKEKVFVQVPGWARVQAELVYMGGRSEYCLVEWLETEGSSDEEKCDECVLRLTKMRVVYDGDGELTVAAHRLSGCYKVSRSEKYRRHMAAFWM